MNPLWRFAAPVFAASFLERVMPVRSFTIATDACIYVAVLSCGGVQCNTLCQRVEAMRLAGVDVL